MAPAITGLSTTNSSAGDEQLLTITGTGFGPTIGTVFFDSPDDGAGGSYISTPLNDILSWSATSILVEIPGGAGTGLVGVQEDGGSTTFSSSTLNINYNISTNGSDPVLLIDDDHDGNGGYTFYFITETANNGVDFTTESSGAALAALQRAVTTWQTETNFSIYTGSSCTDITQTPGADDINIIGFDSDIWDLDVQASNSTLGVCYKYYSSCGPSEWEITDIDLIFRRNGNPNGFGGSVAWEYGPGAPSISEIDFESVALHELGHAHGLGHVISSGAVMHYSVSAGTSNRTLGATDDIAGGDAISNASVAYDPPYVNCGAETEFPYVRDYLANGGGACLPLPVELKSFRARQHEETVLLEWITSSESNNRHFKIERSLDGREFDALANVSSKGSTDSQTDYQQIDQTPSPGLNYYRLWQIDWNDESTYLGMVSVDFETNTIYQIYPNPVLHNSLQLISNTDQAGIAQIDIVDINGRSLNQFTMYMERGKNTFQMDLAWLPAAVYYCRILKNDQMEFIRFVKE